MATVAVPHMSPEEYLERERHAETKSEYLRGEVFAMAGGTPNHALISANVAGELRQQLRERPCRVYSSDLRLCVNASGLYTYPDVMVICGDPVFGDSRTDTVTNPIAMIEVLSESTKSYDRGDKFHYYRTLPSLMEYLTVAQDQIHVEHWVRQVTGQWLFTEVSDAVTSLRLPSLDVQLRVADIYEKAEFG
ncbi:MAG: Uma2 family endonuclease [Acidobacteriota bacterium]|nr:Uma2 family endonuclease [Acidobacteriota bacterium]